MMSLLNSLYSLPLLLSVNLNLQATLKGKRENLDISESRELEVRAQDPKEGFKVFKSARKRKLWIIIGCHLQNFPLPLPSQQKGNWSLKLVLEKRNLCPEAANEFGLYSFQNLMFCDDDISVATEGPRRQVCAAAPRFEMPKTMGASVPRRFASPLHLHSLFCLIDQRVCRRDEHCSQITSRWPRWQDSGERWSGMIPECHNKKQPWETLQERGLAAFGGWIYLFAFKELIKLLEEKI